MSRTILPLLVLTLIVTACSAPDTFHGHPIYKLAEPTVLLASTWIFEHNPSDISNSRIDTNALECEQLTCTDRNDFQTPHTLVLKNPRTPNIRLHELTSIGRINIFRDLYTFSNGGFAFRLLARGDYAAIAVHHWTPATGPDDPQHSTIETLARGELRAEPGTPVPAGTWRGTALLHHIHQPEIFHLAEAKLVVGTDLGEGWFRRARFQTEQPYPHDAPDAPLLKPFSQSIRTAYLETNNTWGATDKEDLKGSFHGSRHEVAIIVFSNVPRLITGGAILYLEEPADK